VLAPSANPTTVAAGSQPPNRSNRCGENRQEGTLTGDAAYVVIEDAWIGRTVHIGDEVQLGVKGPCPRCVMTTLAQGDLPKDSGIFRTAAQHNQVNVGVYASVLRGGEIHRGDAVSVR